MPSPGPPVSDSFSYHDGYTTYTPCSHDYKYDQWLEPPASFLQGPEVAADLERVAPESPSHEAIEYRRHLQTLAQTHKVKTEAQSEVVSFNHGFKGDLDKLEALENRSNGHCVCGEVPSNLTTRPLSTERGTADQLDCIIANGLRVKQRLDLMSRVKEPEYTTRTNTPTTGNAAGDSTARNYIARTRKTASGSEAATGTRPLSFRIHKPKQPPVRRSLRIKSRSSQRPSESDVGDQAMGSGGSQEEPLVPDSGSKLFSDVSGGGDTAFVKNIGRQRASMTALGCLLDFVEELELLPAHKYESDEIHTNQTVGSNTTCVPDTQPQHDFYLNDPVGSREDQSVPIEHQPRRSAADIVANMYRGVWPTLSGYRKVRCQTSGSQSSTNPAALDSLDPSFEEFMDGAPLFLGRDILG